MEKVPYKSPFIASLTIAHEVHKHLKMALIDQLKVYLAQQSVAKRHFRSSQAREGWRWKLLPRNLPCYTSISKAHCLSTFGMKVFHVSSTYVYFFQKISQHNPIGTSMLMVQSYEPCTGEMSMCTVSNVL